MSDMSQAEAQAQADIKEDVAKVEATAKRYPTTTWFFLGAIVCELLHLLAGRF